MESIDHHQGFIVAGSLWITAHLNHNMMAMQQTMHMQR